MNVLWEDFDKDGQMFGFTENYIKVQAPYNTNLVNTITSTRLEFINSEGVFEEETLLEVVV